MSSFTAWCPALLPRSASRLRNALGVSFQQKAGYMERSARLIPTFKNAISLRDSRQDACPAGARTAVAKDTLGRKDMMSNETSKRNVRDKMRVEFAVRNVVAQGKSLW